MNDAAKVVSPILCAVMDKNGELLVTPVGMTFRSEAEAEEFIEWASLHRPETAPYTTVPLVTHADYQALEEEKEDWKSECKALRESYMQRTRDVAEARAELDSLRTRVGELVEADRGFDEARQAEFQASNWVDLHAIQKARDERRRLALEALS